MKPYGDDRKITIQKKAKLWYASRSSPYQSIFISERDGIVVEQYHWYKGQQEVDVTRGKYAFTYAHELQIP